MIKSTIEPYVACATAKRVVYAGVNYVGTPMPKNIREATIAILTLAIQDSKKFSALKIVLGNKAFISRYPPEVRLLAEAMELLEKETGDGSDNERTIDRGSQEDHTAR